MELSEYLEKLRKATLNCFYFVHDVLTDIADESDEWHKEFEKEFDKYLVDLEELE